MNNPDTFFLPGKSKILTGKELADWLVCSYIPKDTRRAYRDLQTYIQGEYPDHICVLYGLLGTGKKSLMRRAMLELPTDQTVFINIKEGEKSKDVVALVKQMIEKHNILYIFIVNTTRMEDFVGIDVFLEQYCNHSVRIVITGDASLALSVSSKNVYLDQYGDEIVPKIYTIETTYTSLNEYTMMTGNDSLDHYIMTSGTCPTEDRGISGKTIFEQEKLAKSYVSTAIISNIIVGAEVEALCGNKYEKIRELQGSKTIISNMINNIVHSMVHEVSRDKINDRNTCFDINKKDNCIQRTSTSEILHALRAIGAISLYKNYTFTNCFESKIYMHLTQPGLAYCIAEKYICDHFSKEDTEHILSKVRKRIMEDMVILGIIQSKKDSKVYRLSKPSNDNAILVYDCTDADGLSLYEIVHSSKFVQPIIVNDDIFCSAIEKQFGHIVKKAIVWEGNNMKHCNYECINVCKFLN